MRLMRPPELAPNWFCRNGGILAGSGAIEQVLRVKRRVAQKFVGAAVKLVCAAARDQVDLAASLLDELRRVAVGLDFELQNAVDVRADDESVEIRIGVEGPVDEEQVRALAVAVDVGRGERVALRGLAAPRR